MGPLEFALHGFWDATARTGALNALDFVLILWPARLLLPPGPAFVAIELGLLLAASVAGVVFARAVGAGPFGASAAGLVTGASGLVIHHLGVGQYPQAFVAAPLLALAALARTWRGERGGVPLAVGSMVASAALYWQNGVILGLGALGWLGAARLSGDRPAPGFWPRALGAAAITAALLVVPALPVVELARSGHAAIGAVAWGTPLAPPTRGSEASYHLIDAVTWGRLFDPAAGWALPALPLVPLLALGLGRRERPWAAVGLLGLLMASGPWPRVPEVLASTSADGARAANPLYAAVYQWVPSANRMRHPNRYALLLVAGTAGLAAAGADRLARRRPRTAGALVVGGAAWATWIGPYPLRANAFPGELLAQVETCATLLTPASGPAAECRYTQADGLFWRPRYPVTWCAQRNIPAPSKADLADNGVRVGALTRALAGDARALDPGSCVLVDLAGDPALVERLEVRFGAPTVVEVPANTLFADTQPHQLAIFRRE